jgi:SAM-dependent methyltransferase
MTQPDRAGARSLARESLDRGDVTGWFDTLYATAQGDPSRVPWADMRVNPHFASWRPRNALDGHGHRALVVGCGLGDDAEDLAGRGFRVTAFDVSPVAIDWCRRRFPKSAVDYHAADLLHPPLEWQNAFDFVLEVYTLQVLPPEARRQAIDALAGFVSPGGTLLVVARGREKADDPGAMPWPLTKEEFRQFVASGLTVDSFEDFLDDEEPPVRRFRVELRRPAS